MHVSGKCRLFSFFLQEMVTADLPTSTAFTVTFLIHIFNNILVASNLQRLTGDLI